VTESISPEEIVSIQDEVAESYGVESDDITIDVVYETTGSISIELLDDTLTDEELEETIEDELAALLGVHEGNIAVTIEDGLARYTITSDSADSAQDIQDLIREPSSIDALTTAIVANVPVNVASVEVDEDIEIEIIVTVDTTSAENNLENSARELEEAFEQQGFTAQADNVFITAAPTVIPTRLPSLAPISAIPSALPTITGAVSSVSMSGPTSGDISSDEVSVIETELAQIYGVDVSDIETDVTYITSGVLDVSIPDEISEIDAINALLDSISDVLGVHSSDVLVTIADDGTVTYSVTGASFEEANTLQTDLSEADFVSQVTENLVESGFDITVASNVANDNV
jgi:hypothetical protein